MKITDLVKKYELNRDYYISSKYNEVQLRADFLNPLFELLGWDIENTAEKSNNEREVLLEEPLKKDAKSNTKKPDYTFRLFSERKFFLEAKKPSVKIESDNEPAKQIRRYGYSAKLKISALSNFEYLAIYDCSEKVVPSDDVNKCRINFFHFSEYAEKFEKLKYLLGQKTVYTGEFDKEWEHIEDKLKLHGVDKLFLNQINEWRILLGNQVYQHKQIISETELNDLVQSYLNSIIFLRVCEDRNIEEYQTLLNFANKQNFKALIRKFYEADKQYNAGLFTQKYKEKIIETSQSVFWDIIKQLYYPESPYSFSVFASDILGNIYEIFIAQKLIIIDDQVFLQNKPEHVNRDIITTPVNIIKDILRQTIIPFCQGKTDKEIINIKTADIACGSGAFLLEAFQLLNDILIDYYFHNAPSKLIQTSVNTYKLPFRIKRKILENCIYGVDKDYNAVEAARFGLLLKLLEQEDISTISGTSPILPELSNNIIFGNSLITPDNCPKGKEDEINPFDFADLRFDVLIGNPPYMTTEDMKNITPLELPIYKDQYESAFKQFDKYYLFIERCIMLLNSNGYLGYIVPSKFTKVGAAKKLRELLSKKKLVNQIVSFGANQIFLGKTNYTCLLIIQNIEHEVTQYYEVKDYKDWRIRNISEDHYDTVECSELSLESWVLVPKYLKPCFISILNQSQKLGDLIGEDNIYNGIQTSANNIYIHTPIKEDKKYYYFIKDNKQWKIEKQLTRPYYQTSSGNDNLNTYRPFEPNSFVIYPYKKVKYKIEFIKILKLRKNYPKAFKYLNYYKKNLSNPKRDIKPEPETSNEWYRYGRHQSLDKCDVPAKIIVGVLSQGNKYAIDYYGTLISSGGTAGYCIITIPEDFPYSIYYIQAILNSKYIEWFSSLYGEVFSGGYIARGTKVLKRLPIHIINFDNYEEKELHDKITRIQQELISKQEEIDQNTGNKRKLTVFQRRFNFLKTDMDNCLKKIYNLEELDKKIPLISEIYGAN